MSKKCFWIHCFLSVPIKDLSRLSSFSFCLGSVWLWIVNSSEVQLVPHSRRVIKLWTHHIRDNFDPKNQSLVTLLFYASLCKYAGMCCGVYQSRFIHNSLWTVSAQPVNTPRKTDLLNPGNAPGTPSLLWEALVLQCFLFVRFWGILPVFLSSKLVSR